jgi:hypothetical protein
LSVIAKDIEKADPASNTDVTFMVEPLSEMIVKNLRPMYFVLLTLFESPFFVVNVHDHLILTIRRKEAYRAS